MNCLGPEVRKSGSRGLPQSGSPEVHRAQVSAFMPSTSGLADFRTSGRWLSLLLFACAISAEGSPINGDFETPDPTDARRPLGWDLPDGLGVRWDVAPAGGSGKAIRIDTAQSEQAMVAQWRTMNLDQWDIPNPAASAVAETYGLSYYSAAFPCAAKQAYRVTGSVLGPAAGIKIWVRGYGPGKDGQRRRLFEAVLNATGDDQAWHPISHCFHPTKNTPAVDELKVMLYAYFPATVYWFDDLRVEPISDEVYADYRSKAGK